MYDMDISVFFYPEIQPTKQQIKNFQLTLSKKAT